MGSAVPFKNKNPNYVVAAFIAILALLAIPTASEFVTALHNRYAVYPAGTDSNMLTTYALLELLFGFLTALGLGLYYKLPWTKISIVLVGILLLISLNIMISAVPSFIPHNWCKRELKIISCNNKLIY